MVSVCTTRQQCFIYSGDGGCFLLLVVVRYLMCTGVAFVSVSKGIKCWILSSWSCRDGNFPTKSSTHNKQRATQSQGELFICLVDWLLGLGIKDTRGKRLPSRRHHHTILTRIENKYLDGDVDDCSLNNKLPGYVRSTVENWINYN